MPMPPSPLPRRLTIARGSIGALALLCTMAAAAAGSDADNRARALAKFDAGYAQCEQRDPAMRGRRDEAYAGLYKLQVDDALRSRLGALRASAAYKAEHRRAAQRLVRDAKASDVSRKLDLQCQGLQREAQR
ncbi:MAG: hypothetical protein U1E89_00290 [Burkholderiaceae bacterium]